MAISRHKDAFIDDLTVGLSRITSADRAAAIVRRALRISGLTHAYALSDHDAITLLEAIAAEGGAIELYAQQVAIRGIDGGQGFDAFDGDHNFDDAA